MPELPGARDESDEAFLDRTFERAVTLLEDGASVTVSELLAGREELRREVELLLADARATVCVSTETLPEVRGYSVIEEIGRGGMGAVYLARQESLGGRRVALKLLPGAAGMPGRARERFLAEARTLAKVRHPHVVTVHDVIESNSSCAYAMEWVDGASLARLIERAKASPTPMDAVRATLELPGTRAYDEYAVFVCRTAIAVARALGELHRAGLVHRDVKPSNVLVRRDGTALLSDFGLAHASDGALTKSGEFVGTVLYASPEQLEGEAESLDARSDVYALGVTLYHALTLHLPFDEPGSAERRASTPTGMLRVLESRTPVPLRARDPKLPRDLETIVATAIESDPKRRYASADELADDLERLLGLQPILARRASWLSRATKFVRRHRAAARGVVAGSVVSLALAVLAVIYAFFVPRWVDEHVREARLALLDPVYANMLFVTEQFRAPLGETRPVLAGESLEHALGSYDAALRWRWFDDALRSERDVVDRALRGEPSLGSGSRLAGLAAYLVGDADTAVARWSDAERERDSRAEPDPLVEAMLGVLLLVRDEPARAYPRLREACRMFPDVGFLATYHADAAVRCGDYETAQRLLEAVRRMPRLDPLDALERVTADLYAATGRDDEAESMYRVAAHSPVAALHLARLLERNGRVDGALEQYLVALRKLKDPALRAEYVAVLQRWWASLSDRERSRAIAATVEISPLDPRSLVARLREYAPAARTSESPAKSDFFATLRRWRSSPPLQSLGLPELAEVLEVDNMQRWSLIPSYSNALKSLQLLAWRTPMPALISSVIRRMHESAVGLVSAASLVALGAQANAQCSLSYDAASGQLPGGCWFIYSAGTPPPPPTVSNGELSFGPTSGQDELYLGARDAIFDFAVGFSCDVRFEVTAADCAINPQQSWPRDGVSLGATDQVGRWLYVCLCDTNVVLGNTPYLPVDGLNVKSAPIAAVGGLLDLRVQSSAMGHELWINSALVATVPLGPVGAYAPSTFSFGDGTQWANAEWSLRSIELSVACPPPQPYCTAGTTSSGCNASMSASGTPSVAATSGFTLNCTNVEGQKFGLIFYGINGPKASPWAPGSSSVLCVKAPVQRTPASNSGGTPGACDGSFSLDFLAYLASHPGALGQPFGVGQCVNAQTWFRDPPAPGTTNLSNGLQFVTVP
ncbi:MAG: protein kinase [Planctomycetes bacterium]|nr:protein kinase [Planctomycetota bacterium]